MDKPDFIEVYDNVVSKEWCEETIRMFERFDEQGFTISRQKWDGEAENRKKDNQLFFPYTYEKHWLKDSQIAYNEEFLTTEYDYLRMRTGSEFSKALEQAGRNYIDKYSSLSIYDLNIYECKIQRTAPGGGYHVWHHEQASNTMRRVLTWILYLNDDFEAGETEFLYQQRRVAPKTGSLVVWPAPFTHEHRGNPPINGTKYIITGWTEW